MVTDVYQFAQSPEVIKQSGMPSGPLDYAFKHAHTNHQVTPLAPTFGLWVSQKHVSRVLCSPTDPYFVGITLLEMAKGEPPYSDLHPMKVSFAFCVTPFEI